MNAVQIVSTKLKAQVRAEQQRQAMQKRAFLAIALAHQALLLNQVEGVWEDN